ncbi:L-seryl-tRNA(Sec) selenium transferase [Candidatus Margulisiibacteriota bacterium]
MSELRNLPGVDILLNHEEIKPLPKLYGKELVTGIIRNVLDSARQAILSGQPALTGEQIVEQVITNTHNIARPSLKPVINATGIILHTNLGRAPLGPAVLKDLSGIASGYSNLEYDLQQAARGKRGCHTTNLLQTITGAEDAIVVNNNAAAIVLALSTLAKDKEVIVSRGELIEIGGSFRIPDIMAASGCKMVEVGTTNRTRLSDYEQAIGENTALLFKAHKSNYEIKGFAEEVEVKELVQLGREHNLPVLYDIGSGLLRKPQNLPLASEPDVKQAVNSGADLITFSGDKLLGGPQSGIITGREELVQQLARAPLMRALRVGKLTIAALASACRHYLTDRDLKDSAPIFMMMERSADELNRLAALLQKTLQQKGLEAQVIENKGQCGGGTLPDLELKSFAVTIAPLPELNKKAKGEFARQLFRQLLALDKPVVGILKQGKILLDVLTIFEDDLPYIAESIARAVKVQ